MGELVNELRSAALVDAEVKGRTVRGHAAVYDTPWSDALIEQTGYIEEVARGAFRKALTRSGNIPLLWQHERRDMLATTQAGTLRLKDEPTALYFEGDLPENPLGDYVLSMVERGDVRGMSYGIATTRADSKMERRGERYVRRVIGAQKILDVSLTYEPSYDAATVELRSLGFAALPLQEIVVGNEAQGDEAVAGSASIAMVEYRKRIDAVRIAIIEEG